MTQKLREELQFAFGELNVLCRKAEGWENDTILDVMMIIRRVLRDEEVTE